MGKVKGVRLEKWGLGCRNRHLSGVKRQRRGYWAEFFPTEQVPPVPNSPGGAGAGRTREESVGDLRRSLLGKGRGMDKALPQARRTLAAARLVWSWERQPAGCPGQGSALAGLWRGQGRSPRGATQAVQLPRSPALT